MSIITLCPIITTGGPFTLQTIFQLFFFGNLSGKWKVFKNINIKII